jgi:hypothetical protein
MPAETSTCRCISSPSHERGNEARERTLLVDVEEQGGRGVRTPGGESPRLSQPGCFRATRSVSSPSVMPRPPVQDALLVEEEEDEDE